jgi:hypothetical protein
MTASRWISLALFVVAYGLHVKGTPDHWVKYHLWRKPKGIVKRWRLRRKYRRLYPGLG